MGRPAAFSDHFAEDICEHLAGGGSLREWCARDGNPGYSVVMRWLRDREEFRTNYAQAREDQAHNDADRIEDVRQQVADGLLQPDAARIIIDSLKWTAGRRAPKVYGDRVAIESDALTSIAGALAEARKRTEGEP